MTTFADALSALKSVVVMQDRLDRMQKDVDSLSSGLIGLKDFAHELDKRLFALEKVIDFGARQSRQNRIEEQ